MKNSFLTFAVLIQSWTFTFGQEKFWQLLLSEQYEAVSIEAEKLAEEQFEYLYLAAVCSHLNYDYDRYHQFSNYYLNEIRGNLANLKIVVDDYYDASNYVSNNLIGIIKQLNPSIELNAAASYFERSLELHSTNPIAHNYLAMMSIQEGAYDKGIVHAKKAIEYDKEYPEPYNNLAFGLYQQGETESAIVNLILCLKNCPKNTYSTYINYINLACEEVVIMVDNSMFGAPGFTNPEYRERLIKALKDHEDNYLSMVEQFLQRSSYTEVGILLRKFTPSEETIDRYYYIDGSLGIQTNDSSKLHTALENLVENKAFDFALELGNFCFENQRYEQAGSIYEEIIPIAATTEQKMKVHANFGTIQLHLQNTDKAIAIFKNVLEFAPKDDITLTNIGICYALKEDTTKAREYLELAKEYCQSDHQMEAIELWLGRLEE